jgi:hypothetical protein
MTAVQFHCYRIAGTWALKAGTADDELPRLTRLQRISSRFPVLLMNAESQSDFNFIERFDHVKNSQFDQHHKFHVYDDSFSEKIKTLHDTF